MKNKVEPWFMRHNSQAAEFRIVEPSGTVHIVKESVVFQDRALGNLIVAMARALTNNVESSEDIESLRKDAERYRWLRAGNAYVPEECGVTGGVELDEICDGKVGG